MLQRAFIAILTFSLGTPGDAPRYICTYCDVVEYLNISFHSKLHARILPKTDLKEPVDVKMDFMLMAILSVEWKNTFATWNPQDSCNSSRVILPMESYWCPPIFILERVNGQTPNLDYMSITHNSSFNSTQPFQATLTCSLMIFKFPFDTQTCNLSVTSFLYPVTDLVMKTKQTPADTMRDSQSYSLTDGEWKLTNLSIIEHMEDLDDGQFSVVTYVISMERRPTLYILNLILPTCALYLLDMAVLFGPRSFKEKTNFQIATIPGSSMLAVIRNNILPTSSNRAPVTVVFFQGTFLLMIMAVLDTFLLLHQQHKSLYLDKVPRSFQQDVHPKLTMTTMTNQSTKYPAKDGAQQPNLPKKAQEKGQLAKHHWQPQEQDLCLPVLEKVFLYSHFFLSLVFFAIISIKWSS